MTLAAATQTDRATGAWIQSLINNAIQKGAKSVTIPPGNYRVAAQQAGYNVLGIYNAKNLTINATGVTLTVTEPSPVLVVGNSQNVKVNGLSIDYNPLPFTQGTIINKSPDNSWYDVRTDVGYDAITGGTRAMFYDPATDLMKPGTLAEFGAVTSLGSRVMRVSGAPLRDDIQVNDRVSLSRDFGGFHAVSVLNSTGSTLQDVTVQSSPSYGFLENGGGGNTYQHIQVAPGPTPAGATRPRLLSSVADAFHSIDAGVGPKVLNSLFADQGDDGVAIHGEYSLVGKATGSTLIVSSPYAKGLAYQVGDKVRSYNADKSSSAEATVLSIQPDNSLNFSSIVNKFLPTRYAQFTTGYKITLDKPLQVATGDLISSPDRDGSGYQIVNTTVKNNRARGIIAKASDGLIKGNTIDGSTVAGIVVAGEPFSWQEGDFSHNVVIQDNVVRNTGGGLHNPWETESGAISITGSAGWNAQDNSNIIVTGNTVQNAFGANLVVNLARDVTVGGNQFIAPLSRPTTSGSAVGVDPTSVISIDRASDVRLSSNTVLDIGSYGEGLLRSTANSSGLSSADTGVRLIHNDVSTVVADYRHDFQTVSPQNGWKYLWNQNGAIGTPNNYVPLVKNGSIYSADATAFPAHSSGGFVNLGAVGGHPGVGVSEGAASDRYAIAAYTVNQSGLYAIRDSFIRALNMQSTDIRVFINVNGDAPVMNEDFAAGVTASFDVMLGQLKLGDTIYVGVGPDGSHGFDTFNFDFGIAKFLTGDYNRDGVVNAADYTVWRDTLGSTTSPQADGNGSGAVDAKDYQIWKNTLLSSSGSAGGLIGLGGALPEPASGRLTLLLLGTLALSRLWLARAARADGRPLRSRELRYQTR